MIGELIQLINLIKINPSADLIWGGPEGHRHDFSNGILSLEVKTTTMRHGVSVTINSIDQLNPCLEVNCISLLFPSKRLMREA